MAKTEERPMLTESQLRDLMKTRYPNQWEPKKYLVTRRVMDPREGNLGHINLTVTAWTGPEALFLANLQVAEMNDKFLRHIKERGLFSKWESYGWKNPELVLEWLTTRPKRRSTQSYDPMSEDETNAMLGLFYRNRKKKNDD